MDKVSRPTFFLSGIRTSKKSISPLYNIEFLSWEKEKKGIQQWGSCDCPPARPFSNAEPEQRPVMYFLIFTLSLSFSLLLDVFIIIIIIVESIMIPFSPWRWGMASGFIVVCRESPPVCTYSRFVIFHPQLPFWSVGRCVRRPRLHNRERCVMTLTKGIRERERELKLVAYSSHPGGSCPLIVVILWLCLRRKKNLFDSAGVAAVSIKKKRETDSKRKGVKQICECNLFQEKRGKRREYRKSPWWVIHELSRTSESRPVTRRGAALFPWQIE